MIREKIHLSLNWKAKLTLILSLFVFTAYNNNVSANTGDAVQTELLLSKDFVLSDLTFSLTNSIQFVTSSTEVLECDSKNIFSERHSEYSNLIVKNRLTTYYSFKSNTCSFWELQKMHSVFPSEDTAYTI